MLVLSRRKNEAIVIGGDITVVVTEIVGDKVKLGVEAPREVPVHRREVHNAIERQRAAARASLDPASQPAAPQLDTAEPGAVS